MADNELLTPGAALAVMVALVSGCGTQRGGSYCGAVQRPFQWRSDAEIGATPIRVVRYVETEAETWERLCQR